MHRASRMRTGRWIGILAVVAAVAAIPAGVAARGSGEQAEHEREEHEREGRHGAWAAVRALFGAGADGSYLGVRVGDVEEDAESVDGQLADYFGVSAGVLVRHVEEDTVAAAAGLRAGDVITAIDGEAVEDLGALRRRVSALDLGASFAIAVVREGAGMSLPAELEDEAERRPRGRRRGTGI